MPPSATTPIVRLEGLRPGGYGVLIARHFVDDLIYDEKGNM